MWKGNPQVLLVQVRFLLYILLPGVSCVQGRFSRFICYQQKKIVCSEYFVATLTLISDKWKVLILRDLMPGTKRFGELKKAIGHVSQKVLTAQLRQMEASGLVTRTVFPEVPPHVEYTLTELGYSLKPILDAMWEWGENYKEKNSNGDMESSPD